MTKADFSSLAAKWPSSFVARDQVDVFSGGILHPRTLANLDSRGEGPQGRIRLGRKIAYSVPELLAWMTARAERVK